MAHLAAGAGSARAHASRARQSSAPVANSAPPSSTTVVGEAAGGGGGGDATKNVGLPWSGDRRFAQVIAPSDAAAPLGWRGGGGVTAKESVGVGDAASKDAVGVAASKEAVGVDVVDVFR